MSAVLQVTNLSKRYRRHHHARPRYRSLRDEIADWVAAPFRAVERGLLRRSTVDDNRARTEDFWALKDVSFEVPRGEVLGIIGRNGAGKSTLLKILSRVTDPSAGRVVIEGRVASLLEVGAGFHPELTGRENIFLNGAILGMTRVDIRKRFDEIVAFAEVERFLDTPIKRYSSGMAVRLAFAVAAHLDAEILILDEILAVGDARFQTKSLAKMRQVSTREGRTVVLVSHQMDTIRQLCTKALLLVSGELAGIGSTGEVIETYLGNRSKAFIANGGGARKEIRVDRASTIDPRGNETTTFRLTDPITINVTCQVNRWIPNAELRLFVTDSRSRPVFTSDTPLKQPVDSRDTRIQALARLPPRFLRPGSYVISLSTFVNNLMVIDVAADVMSFTIRDDDSTVSRGVDVDYGCVFSPCEWKLEYADASRLQEP